MWLHLVRITGEYFGAIRRCAAGNMLEAVAWSTDMHKSGIEHVGRDKIFLVKGIDGENIEGDNQECSERRSSAQGICESCRRGHNSETELGSGVDGV